MTKVMTEQEVLEKIPDREEGKNCIWAKEGEYHFIMYSSYTNSLKCGTCYLRTCVWADLHPDKVKIIHPDEKMKIVVDDRSPLEIEYDEIIERRQKKNE